MNCSSCEQVLMPEGIEFKTEYQFDNALWIGFFGGYGMFVDDIDSNYRETQTLKGAAHEAVLCHDCAHKLCEANPWIKGLLKPETSHSHKAEFWDSHPAHKGWDNPGETLF